MPRGRGSVGREQVNAASGGVWPGGGASGAPVGPSRHPRGPRRYQGQVRKDLESAQALARARPAPCPCAGCGGVLKHGSTCPWGRSLHRPPVTRGWGTRHTRSRLLPAPGQVPRGHSEVLGDGDVLGPLRVQPGVRPGLGRAWTAATLLCLDTPAQCPGLLRSRCDHCRPGSEA